MMSKGTTQDRISILRKMTASPPKSKSDNKRKIILKSRIKFHLESLDLLQTSKENVNMELKFVPRYAEADKKDDELRKRYNIVENVEYFIVKIQKFGMNKRVVAIKDFENDRILRFLDLEHVCKVFNVLISNCSVVGNQIKNSVRIICDWQEIK